MIDAVEEVLEKALEFVEPGVTVGEFGTYVEKQVPAEYNVVQNLTGHYLGHYEQHAGVSIPNNHNQNAHEFEKGDAIAIEPFLSTGSGMVKNGAEGNIYKLESTKVRDRTARKLVKKIQEFNGLPFTQRWLNLSGRERMAFKKMVQQEIVHSYPVLRDRSGSTVVQAEHTVLVGMGEDGENIITTRN
jgi:methionyl aminopeptidase